MTTQLELPWKPYTKFTMLQHVFIGAKYELFAFDIPPTANFPARDCGYEIFTGPKFNVRFSFGKAKSMQDAMLAAEAAMKNILT